MDILSPSLSQSRYVGPAQLPVLDFSMFRSPSLLLTDSAMHTQHASDFTPFTVDTNPLQYLGRKMSLLDEEIVSLKEELAEERKQREMLSEIVPHLMKNQDEVLKLLQTLNPEQ